MPIWRPCSVYQRALWRAVAACGPGKSPTHTSAAQRADERVPRGRRQRPRPTRRPQHSSALPRRRRTVGSSDGGCACSACSSSDNDCDTATHASARGCWRSPRPHPRPHHSHGAQKLSRWYVHAYINHASGDVIQDNTTGDVHFGHRVGHGAVGAPCGRAGDALRLCNREVAKGRRGCGAGAGCHCHNCPHAERERRWGRVQARRFRGTLVGRSPAGLAVHRAPCPPVRTTATLSAGVEALKRWGCGAGAAPTPQATSGSRGWENLRVWRGASPVPRAAHPPPPSALQLH